MSEPETPDAVTEALISAVAAGTREAFEQLLSDDVRWSDPEGGAGWSGRAGAGDRYAGVLADGHGLRVTRVSSHGGPLDQQLRVRLQVTSPDRDRPPAQLDVLLTVRDGLIADILDLGPTPRVELLFIAGCPHYEQFRPHLTQLLADHQIDAPITLVRVDSDGDAQRLRFLGSPSLRVDGRDVEPVVTDRDSYGLTCRLYRTPDGTAGAPRDRWILDALVADPIHESAVRAVRTGDVAALRRLLDGHPDLATARLARRGGRTLLHVATDWPGHLPDVAATIAALVRAGADPSARGLGRHPETPLHWAASSDDVNALDALLDAGADIDARGAVIGDGTPLADATAFGNWAAAHRLVQRGARTTLWDAAALGLLSRVHQHLAADNPSREDITRGFWAACHGGRLDTAALLLDRGADVNWIGWDGLTPLDAARRSQAPAVVRWLEQHGARAAPGG